MLQSSDGVLLIDRNMTITFGGYGEECLILSCSLDLVTVGHGDPSCVTLWSGNGQLAIILDSIFIFKINETSVNLQVVRLRAPSLGNEVD